MSYPVPVTGLVSTKNISGFGFKVISWPLNELVKLTMLWPTWPRALDNMKYLLILFSYFSSKPYDMTHHLNRLIKAVQMRGHNIGFYAELTKIIPNYHQAQQCTLSYLEFWYTQILIEYEMMDGWHLNLGSFQRYSNHIELPYFFGYKTDFFPSKTIPKIFGIFGIVIPPLWKSGGYTGLHLSVIPSVLPSVLP